MSSLVLFCYRYLNFNVYIIIGIYQQFLVRELFEWQCLSMCGGLETFFSGISEIVEKPKTQGWQKKMWGSKFMTFHAFVTWAQFHQFWTHMKY